MRFCQSVVERAAEVAISRVVANGQLPKDFSFGWIRDKSAAVCLADPSSFHHRPAEPVDKAVDEVSVGLAVYVDNVAVDAMRLSHW